MNKKVLIVVILVFCLIIFCAYKKSEGFNSQYAINDKIYTGHPREGYSLMDDSLFTNVITFNNDDDPYAQGGKIGLQKCLEQCDGKCIEFGVTGIGYCFPKNIPSNSY